MDPQWLNWAKRLQAIAHNGLHYATNPFDRDRYEQIGALAGEMLTACGSVPPPVVEALRWDEAGHQTPRVDVRGLVLRDDAVLLVRERTDGGWTLPGGWADIGDTPAGAVVREIREESGYETRALRLLAAYDRDHPRHGHPPHVHHIYKLFFLCELVGGEPLPSMETDGVGFFACDGLPPLSLTRVTPGQIARLAVLARRPEQPADFD